MKEKSHKSHFTKTEKDDVDIWELHNKEREHLLTQIVKNRRTNRFRTLFEIIAMLSFIFYMLYDMHKAGDLDTIFKFL